MKETTAFLLFIFRRKFKTHILKLTASKELAILPLWSFRLLVHIWFLITLQKSFDKKGYI